MNLADHALEAVCRAWHVFPLRTLSKLPATKHGCHDATDDPERIWSWWNRHPQSNIGVATGPSRLVVIDLDPTNDDDGHCAEAFAALCALAAGHDGGLPRTLEVATPRGGEHHYYQVPDGTDLPRNSASRLGPHIDVRGDGGYVVGTGSALDNGRYDIAHDTDVAEAPAWLIEACTRRRANGTDETGRTGPMPAVGDDESPQMKRLIAACKEVAFTPSGRRNDMLYWAAKIGGRVISEGTNAVVVITQLEMAGRRAGLDETEIKNTIASGIENTGRPPP